MTEPAVQTNPSIPPALQTLPLTLSVRVGTAKRTVGDLMAMSEGTLVVLNSKIDEPVEICIEDRVIAKGNLVEAEDGEGLAVKLTELVTTEE
ncbi:MAG: FliM/FliN family flagellar motor switch protein [Pseudomonadota bacterium]